MLSQTVLASLQSGRDLGPGAARRSAAGSVMAVLVAVCDEAQASITSLVAAYSIEKRTFNATDDWMVALYKY